MSKTIVDFEIIYKYIYIVKWAEEILPWIQTLDFYLGCTINLKGFYLYVEVVQWKN